MSERLRDGCGRASAGRRRRAPFGREREREQRGIGTEGETRESERGSQGLRGIAGGDQGRRRQPGREEVAGARGRARRARARPPGRGGRRQGREAVVGWASQVGELGRLQVSGPGRLLFFLFFSSVLFYLIYFATVLILK